MGPRLHVGDSHGESSLLPAASVNGVRIGPILGLKNPLLEQSRAGIIIITHNIYVIATVGAAAQHLSFRFSSGVQAEVVIACGITGSGQCQSRRKPAPKGR
jgi:hypothetical protein